MLAFTYSLSPSHVLLVMLLCRGMTSRVAQVMAPLLPGIRTGVGNNGLENGGGEFRGGGEETPYRLDCQFESCRI